MNKKLTLALLLSLLAPVLTAGGLEKYSMTVDLNKDGSANVSEKYTISHPSEQDLTVLIPTHYTSNLGIKKADIFRISEIKENGQSYSLYKEEDLPFYKRITLTTKHNSSNESTYEVSYITSALVRYYGGGDELYIPFTAAQGADFAEGKIIINLPYEENVAVNIYHGDTGELKRYEGAEISNANGHISIDLLTSVSDGEEVVVSIHLPKGVLDKHEAKSEIAAFVREHKILFDGSVFFFSIIAYYILLWVSLGIYSRKDITAVISEPPAGMSPSAVRYMYKKIPGQVSDKFKMLSSAVLQMAVNGIVTIERKDSAYTITLSGKNTKQTDEEKLIISRLFPQDKETFSAKEYTSSYIHNMTAALQEKLEIDLHGKYFKKNNLWFAINYILAGAYILWALIFMWPESWIWTLTSCALIAALAVLFNRMLNPFNKEGRKVMEEIEEFRKYLMAENTSDSLKDFYVLLPYAVALGVENKWTRKFAEALYETAENGGVAWYKTNTTIIPASYYTLLSAELGSGLALSFSFTGLTEESKKSC
ncbi:putative membrane protein (DUF2207) [Parelusimicrobium proximum]|uniref:DUF2207 domain-containing protein n=1 Tax=Parelusimicrobium proximum TaxID=3228953 RepID=UPI003D16593B